MILVDAHVVVWLTFDQDQISRKARTAIDEARKNADGLAISERAADGGLQFVTSPPAECGWLLYLIARVRDILGPVKVSPSLPSPTL